MRVIRVSCAVVALLVTGAISAAGQTASLELRVVDPNRAVVVGAPVVVTHLATGAQQTALTGSDGVLRLSGLAPGEYRLEVVAERFTTHVETVTLGPDARMVEARLEIAPIVEAVTVEAVATVPTIGRVSTPLRDQPLTVHTLTSEFLESYAINDVVDALQYVPNVTAYEQYGAYQYFTFRGFSDSVQLVDGLRNEGNRVSTQLANVDRVEILKGPASVLYGADALGGTVNLVLRQPSAEPQFDFAGTLGRWDTYRGMFGASGRVGRSNAFYRLDVGGDSATGFRHDPSRRLNVTPSLRWQLPHAARIEARYSFDRNRRSGDSGIPLMPLDGDFTPDPERTAIGDPLGRAIQGDGTTAIPSVPRDVRFNTPQDFALGTDQNVRLSYAQPLGRSFAFRNTVGYRHFDDEYWMAEFLDVMPPSQVNRGFLYFKHHRRPITTQAELNGQARLGVMHDLLVGWDYQGFANHTHRRAGANFNTTPMDLFDPVETHVHVNVHDFPVTRIDHSRNRTNAAFFQDTLTVLPQLKVVVSARFDHIRRRNHNNPIVDGVETEGPITRRTSTRFTHRAGLVYQPNARVDLYAQNSASFKPNFNIQPDGTGLEPEYGEQWEVGQRLRLLQERFQLTTAAFHIERRNVARAVGGGWFEQVGKLRSRGFEAELSGRLASGWRVNAGYGFTHARFVDFLTAAGADLSGNRPRRVPAHTVTLSTGYVFRNGIAVNAGTQVVSHQFINDPNTVGFNGYERVNLGASYTRGRVQYALNLANVTDRQYWASSLGNRQLYPGQPFNALATVRIRTY